MEDIKLTEELVELLSAQTAEEPFLRTNASRDSKLKMLSRPLPTRILPWTFITINSWSPRPTWRTFTASLVLVTPESSKSDLQTTERSDTLNKWKILKDLPWTIPLPSSSKLLLNETNSLKLFIVYKLITRSFYLNPIESNFY